MSHRFAFAALLSTVLVAGGCDRASTALSSCKPSHMPTASQRFFMGQAIPGEFLTLESLPPIPATFDDAEP